MGIDFFPVKYVIYAYLGFVSFIVVIFWNFRIREIRRDYMTPAVGQNGMYDDGGVEQEQ